jgi:hypothetical protein
MSEYGIKACYRWSHDLQPKDLYTSVIDHLPRVSRQSLISANDKGDRAETGAVYRPLGIYLTVEETPSARRPSDEGYATTHHLKWDSLPPNDVDRIAHYVSEEGRKEEKELKLKLLHGVMLCGQKKL